MDPQVRRTLLHVARRLDGADVVFSLGGSGLLWALGLADEVGDLDVMLPAEGESAALAALASGPVSVDRDGTELWATAWFATIELGGVDVDLLGGMALRHAGGVARLDHRPYGWVDVDGHPVPYADPAGWWVVYRAYKPAKAALLEEVVGPRRRAQRRDELGLPHDW